MNRAAKLILLVLSASGFFYWQAFFSHALAGSNPKIIEAAKSEGAVAYYTTTTLSQSKKVADKFQAKYPFIRQTLGLLHSAPFDDHLWGRVARMSRRE